MFKNKKAFTLTEMIIVIVIIGILMAGTTIYLQGSDETRKVIEAQGCATTIGGYINNYIFYSLTSRNLKTSTDTVSPDIYGIKLKECSSNNLCDSIEFSYYIYNEENNNYDEGTYAEYEIYDTCHSRQNNIKLHRKGGRSNDSVIKMNKGFSPTKITDKNIFYIDNGTTPAPLVGEIIMDLCLDNNCSVSKEITERVVDGRTQTISLRNCAYYNDDRTCKTREGCKKYDDTDPAACACKKFKTDDPTVCEEEEY